MSILGHSTILLTMNTYAHVLPEVMRDAADAMDRALDEGIDWDWLHSLINTKALARANRSDQGFCGYAARDSNSEPAD